MHQTALSVLDEEALSRLSELDPSGKSQLLARVLKAFEASIERLVPQLEAARAGPDLERILHVAHTLKSSSASIGAARMSTLCGEVESMARDARTERLGERLEALSGEIAKVRRAVQARIGVRA